MMMVMSDSNDTVMPVTIIPDSLALTDNDHDDNYYDHYCENNHNHDHNDDDHDVWAGLTCPLHWLKRWMSLLGNHW